jgi:hypothetical protein
MNWLYRIFDKYYPCKCRKAAAASSAALTLAVMNFCNQIDSVKPKGALEIVKQSTKRKII